jgi:hypothetical protein
MCIECTDEVGSFLALFTLGEAMPYLVSLTDSAMSPTRSTSVHEAGFSKDIYVVCNIYQFLLDAMLFLHDSKQQDAFPTAAVAIGRFDSLIAQHKFALSCGS